ncbi:macro domain-containing protein [Sphingomonas sp. 2R-10]|uniref:macro domain-containing protein n=1 Tax=Sphingomonas sp. 2R-10 TaxID=3045148 RepID=UPI000F786CDA|nr:macro domain-containing protein [Sphingomonas sp. 2R-10]MDJ0277682.1 macro domain-containing protein [Sphingomonas sp. 2R-10]
MIAFVDGDLLASRADMLVNAVNCAGVMGAGIALAFRRRHPDMFDDYRRVCLAGRLRPGRLHVWRLPDGRRIVNLPTKRHWRDGSRYGDIDAGLAALRTCIERFEPASVAVPALGCGCGGLDWQRIAAMIRATLVDLDARILFYQPRASRSFLSS